MAGLFRLKQVVRVKAGALVHVAAMGVQADTDLIVRQILENSGARPNYKVARTGSESTFTMSEGDLKEVPKRR